MNLPIRSYLYVPGYDERRIEKALAGEADAVVLDLEDAVVPARKDEARETVVQVLKAEPEKPVFVRVNAVGTELAAADIDAVVGRHLAGLRLPKIEYVESVRLVAETLAELRSEAGIQCLIESALGLEWAFEIANSHVRVTGISLGEADLAADLGVSDESGLLYARSRIVTAARAAGLPPPVQSVYTNVDDIDGLRRSTEEGKRLGFVGRSTIHPSQVPVVNEVFTPTKEEIGEAQALLDRLASEAASGTGAFVLEDGRFVDGAVVESARRTLDLARRRETP
ncbi:MAG TPA: CoA ester lyase [Rubrobacter sp.]|nr:CoA ester lyase [Rubrobacter sp.]